MDTLLLLIAINFIFVPFLQEAEAQGRQLRRFPGLLWVLRLSHVRRANWFMPFCIFAFLFLAGAAARMQQGAVDVLALAVHFAIMQAVLWTVVILSVRKHASIRFGAGTPAGHPADGRLLAPVLPRL